MSPNKKNNEGFEDHPDGIVTKYKDCGQDPQMDESWKKGVKMRKGRLRDSEEHGSSSHTLLCIRTPGR